MPDQQQPLLLVDLFHDIEPAGFSTRNSHSGSQPAQPSCARAPSVSPLSAASLRIAIHRYLSEDSCCVRRTGHRWEKEEEGANRNRPSLRCSSKYVDSRHRRNSLDSSRYTCNPLPGNHHHQVASSPSRAQLGERRLRVRVLVLAGGRSPFLIFLLQYLGSA